MLLDTIEGGEMATSSTPFAPVTRRTISSEIRAQLLEAIRTGELQPGSPVPAERQLCEQFGVARTSVREAIQGLTASGYLERRGNRPVVAERLPEIRLKGDSATLDERKALVRQLFEVRRTIEPAMSELAARRATAAERVDITELAGRSTNQLDEFRTIDRGFHTAISRACGNPLLQEVYGKTLGALFDSGELASLLYAEINRHEVSAIIASSTAAHRAIADALVAGRRKATIAAVQAHLDDVERRMIDRLL
ncbi:MAG: GntR family transcriptional regulator, transcriptional repressor for pyruvate dehydrogenase complex [Ilumatobacteraceae bacterium]